MGVSKVKDAGKEKAEKVGKKEVKRPRAEKAKDIVRLADTDVDATKPIVQSLRSIKGISHAMARAICQACGFVPSIRINQLTPEQLERLEAVIRDAASAGIPPWLLNRRKDIEGGKDLHLVGGKLDMATKFDIRRLIDLKGWHGMRHAFGLPTRGQRTRSHFRKGKTVGVMRKAARLLMQKAEKEKK